MIVVFFGNHGVGKTSVCRKLAEMYGGIVPWPDAEYWPSFPMFLESPHSIGYQNQVEITLTVLSTYLSAAKAKVPVFLDTSLVSVNEVHTRSFFNRNILTASNFESLQFINRHANACMPSIDLKIMLRADLPLLHKRLMERARREDKIVNIDTLHEHQTLWDEWAFSQGDENLHVIDTGENFEVTISKVVKCIESVTMDKEVAQ